jgi:hypothetical protein
MDKNKGNCGAVMILTDDSGEYVTHIFSCQKEEGHDGRHEEICERFSISWDGDDRKPCKCCGRMVDPVYYFMWDTSYYQEGDVICAECYEKGEKC